MINHIVKFSVLVLSIFFGDCTTKKPNSKEDNLTTKQESYLGQKPPSLTPEIFAPQIVSIKGKNASSISFAPDLDEMYFFSPHKKWRNIIYLFLKT
ncbi:hypothetical protein MTsPCn5_15710 [Croceitalea sp. MTPC5]|uniref:hypothetical protein n=1 Tax=Croceitalea sp. MTPC5 TaxID=3056565 RepID=UPI002B3DF984|nr:hypothetical protein MTsPCn5_15710 [Croceitalea sp. MTPC5]